MIRTLTILKQARKLITSARKWTKYRAAVDENDVPCDPASRKAARWCAIGAIQRAAYERRVQSSPYAAIEALKDVLPRGAYQISQVNDELGHRATLQLFDRAIKRTEKRR